MILCPEIREILNALRSRRGCACAFMTGSGSACVGVFSQKTSAEAARDALRGQCPRACCALTRRVR